MKKKILSMMLAVVTLSAAAELREDAFIIRTTDGAAQGLLFGDVEKITFSNLDDEGIPRTGVYYQELHYPDTIIRVPVTEIKEVSFEKPKSKLNDNVVLIYEKGLIDYLMSQQDEYFYFKKDIPTNLIPKEGQILASLDPNCYYGIFAYRVKTVTTYPGAIEVVCQKVDKINEIYAELIGVEAVTEDTPGVRECLLKAGTIRSDRRREVSGGGKQTIPFDISLSYEKERGNDEEDDTPGGGSDDKFILSGGIKGELQLRIAYEFSSQRDYMSVYTEYEYTPYFGFAYQSEAKWEKTAWDPIQHPFIKVTPPSCPIFTVSFGASPFFRALGTANINIMRTFPTTHSRTMAIYENGSYRSSSASANAEKDDNNDGGFSANYSLDGSIMVGANMGLYVGTTRVLDTAIGIVAEALVGPKISASMAGSIENMPTFEGPNSLLHNLIKDWNVSATWCSVEMSISYYQQILGGEEKKVQIASMSCDADPWSATLVPDFDELEVEKVRKSRWLGQDEPAPGDPNYSQYEALKFTLSNPEGTWLFSLNPGYAVYENDKFLKFDFTRQDYGPGIDSSDFEDLTWVFDDWYPNRTYTVYPAYRSHMFGDIRVQAPVTFEYPGIVSSGPSSYKWKDKYTVECKFTGSSDVDPFILCPHFVGRGVIISLLPLHVDDKGMLADFDLINPVFDFLPQDLEEGEGYGTAYNVTTYSLSEGTDYYYCSAVQVEDRNGNRFYYCGDVRTFHIPESSRPKDLAQN